MSDQAAAEEVFREHRALALHRRQFVDSDPAVQELTQLAQDANDAYQEMYSRGRRLAVVLEERREQLMAGGPAPVALDQLRERVLGAGAARLGEVARSAAGDLVLALAPSFTRRSWSDRHIASVLGPEAVQRLRASCAPECLELRVLDVVAPDTEFIRPASRVRESPGGASDEDEMTD
jgi:hypothetical protein